ncbi:c-type cytochrome [Acidiphilium sp.]|uniref:c-type cytochrome n=1 Tax=Acidiphilium sp. TaxID=527 RepID=UPI003D046B1D
MIGTDDRAARNQRSARRRRIVAGAVAFCGALLCTNLAQATAPLTAPPDSPSPPAYPALPAPNTAGMSKAQVAVVQRGEFLAAAGDCMPCHTAPGGKPFAGGFSFVTPFGALFGQNITPDKATGIGRWTDAQFWAALHDGVIPGKSLLVFPNYMYPAMPYTSYAKLSRPDVMAIKAYLDAIPAVHQPDVKDQLDFPFNIRAGLLTWRMLFFSHAPIKYAKTWTPSVRRGAYLVEALGHCSDCHSPRNLMLAVKSGETLAGSRILGETWYANNISSSKRDGIGGWSRASLVSFLHDGGNMTHGSDFGPMKSVDDDSLSQLPIGAINDLAAYLQTATPPRRNSPQPPAAHPSAIAAGRALYAENCAACHHANGAGNAAIAPNLKGNAAVWQGPADNVIGATLAGLEPWHPGGLAMPSYAASLNDHQIAAIANYVRTAWGNPGVANATAAEVLAMRETAPSHALAAADTDYLDLPPIASAAARRLHCPMLSPGDASDWPQWGQIMRGATIASLKIKATTLAAAIRQADATVTDPELTHDLIMAACPVIATQPGVSRSAQRSALHDFTKTAATIAHATP